MILVEVSEALLHYVSTAVGMLLNGFAQQRLLSHTGRCFDIRYSSDGTFLLSASEDGTAILWDVKSRKVNTHSHMAVNLF